MGRSYKVPSKNDGKEEQIIHLQKLIKDLKEQINRLEHRNRELEKQMHSKAEKRIKCTKELPKIEEKKNVCPECGATLKILFLGFGNLESCSKCSYTNVIKGIGKSDEKTERTKI